MISLPERESKVIFMVLSWNSGSLKHVGYLVIWLPNSKRASVHSVSEHIVWKTTHWRRVVREALAWLKKKNDNNNSTGLPSPHQVVWSLMNLVWLHMSWISTVLGLCWLQMSPDSMILLVGGSSCLPHTSMQTICVRGIMYIKTILSLRKLIQVSDNRSSQPAAVFVHSDWIGATVFIYNKQPLDQNDK